MEWGWESWGWAEHPLEKLLPQILQQYPEIRPLLGGFQQRERLSDWAELKQAYHQFFHNLLPAWVTELDPDTPYWPSSPSSGTPFANVNGQEQGDAHYWEVWHGRQPFTAYRQVYPRFMSEFGFQSLPPLRTIQSYADEADWNMTSYIMEHHQRGNHGNGLIIAQMTGAFRMPKDFNSLVYLSMVLQAEGIRYGVEHWRRNMERVGGTLYWQLNDCWPVASWSSIDYYGRWKALHYASKRFYAPILLSVEDSPPRMTLHVTSDLGDEWTGSMHWSLENLAGEVLVSGQDAVSAAPRSSTEVITLDFSQQISKVSERQMILVCELRQDDRPIMSTVSTFVASKHLALTKPKLSTDLQLEGEQLILQISSDTLARFVELNLDGQDVIFSDNYFDVAAGRTVEVTAPRPDGWSLARARSALQVRSLYDSFA
jgi:beta-mannosidase